MIARERFLNIELGSCNFWITKAQQLNNSDLYNLYFSRREIVNEELSKIRAK